MFDIVLTFSQKRQTAIFGSSELRYCFPCWVNVSGDSLDPSNFQSFIHDFKIHHSQPSLTYVTYYVTFYFGQFSFPYKIESLFISLT